MSYYQAGSVPCFRVVSGRSAYETIHESIDTVIETVKAAYRAHEQKNTVNPDSFFLCFPNREQDRIIALPAHIEEPGRSITGIKWIASFPDNLSRGIPRASATLILNDPATGYPLACLEASVISAARTAASAVLGALWLNGHSRFAPRLGIVGTGFIARYIVEFFLRTGWHFEELHLHDMDADSAEAFALRFGQTVGCVKKHDSATELARTANLIVFTTTASSPYITDPASLSHNPLVLHVSLRDLSPEVVLSAHNVVDDVDHCLKANTSLHLAHQQTGRRDFVGWTLPAILCGAPIPDRSRPVIFSPFGMGILDLAVGLHVLDATVRNGAATELPDFFYDLTRV
ncbi:2,3-diaminopropionate biosynthesis protein SbnB [Mesorhizobium sp. M0136]|uniref:2,3-diaminopropionate biosynthesis protein SbnB n=1 Tax=Mesorhizobium sp. M0136 TaxID=2956890 RepID=UPI003336CD0B